MTLATLEAELLARKCGPEARNMLVKSDADGRNEEDSDLRVGLGKVV